MTSSITLRSGVELPRVGFGTYKIPAADADEAVATALEVGYRHIDCAAMYGNERDVGRGIRASRVPRTDLFVTSKLDNPYHAVADVRPAFERSLSDLGLDYLDLYLIHWPLARSTDFVATWEAMSKLPATGLVRAVGVSNFTVAHLRAAIAGTGLVPEVNQVEVTPYLRQDELRAFHRENEILTEAWSPLARGRAVADPVVVALASQLGRTPAQVVLGWHLQRGDVVLPKSTRRERMVQNLNLFGFELSPEAMALLDALDSGERSGSDPDIVEVDGGRRS